MEENKKKALDESQLDEVAGGISFKGGLRNIKEDQCGDTPMKVVPTLDF